MVNDKFSEQIFTSSFTLRELKNSIGFPVIIHRQLNVISKYIP